MKRIQAGTKVNGGYYWNLSRWEITHVKPEGGALPGTDDDSFLKMPLMVLLAVAPIMGLLYVMFLPFIGFAMVLGLIAKRTAAAVQDGAVQLAAIVHPGWRPGEAYLTGKRAKKGEAEEPAKDEVLDELAKEIESKRGKK